MLWPSVCIASLALIELRLLLKQLPNSLDDLLFPVRLGEKYRFSRNPVARVLDMSRNNDHLDRRPPITNDGRKAHAVEAARHIDVGKHNADIVAFLQNSHGFCRICRGNRLISCRLNEVDGSQAQQRFVFDYL